MPLFAIRGPILNPQSDGSVDFIADGILVASRDGTAIDYVGPYMAAIHANLNIRQSNGLILPPLTDCHIHIPQHPIRGHFLDGVTDDTPHGRLLAGLERNVFPAEAECDDAAHAERVTWRFLQDTLAQGVTGGAAYMTVSPAATRIALEILPPSWSVGMVLMNQNCPSYLRTDEATVDHDLDVLAAEFGQRFIVTDRFAVAVSSPLRRRAVATAAKHGLRMQTHLNEQIGEKAFVERFLYPQHGTYTNVYAVDGLLSHAPILAHCVHMSPTEFDQIAAAGAFVAHCPTSNALLGSGIAPLDRIAERNIPYAICTDVGASPTTSLLAEMAQFLRVHEGRSTRATPSEALFRVTLGADAVMQRSPRPAAFAAGEPVSFIEVDTFAPVTVAMSADEVIRDTLLGYRAAVDHMMDAYSALELAGLSTGHAMSSIKVDVATAVARLEGRVARVTLGGVVAFDRDED
ncbi:MAG TPA: amidohydrolase family protein [Tepidisphaeraceae bacterium]|jgi:guanine deaminase|nr:amidohydrolase family protein [Tepidisphaeraceae bacterium]